MELRVRDSTGSIGLDFGFWLKNEIKIALISNIRLYNFDAWEEFFNTSPLLKKTSTSHVSIAQVILFLANVLECSGSNGEVVIRISPSACIPGFLKLPAAVAAKLINYGTLDIKGCNIFTKTLNEFTENIDMYVKHYYLV